MKPRANVIAQKLLNLYRQEHVIIGGWAAVNKVFVDEAATDVIQELRDMPTGRALISHIENLRSGRTPMNTIERELLPYGGMMAESASTVPLTQDEWNELVRAIEDFTPDEAGLARIQRAPVIKKFGDEWTAGVRSALAGNQPLLDKWSVITKTHRAYTLWNQAGEIINNPLSERTRAQVQAEMPEYETYLPMFGDAGTELLGKLRTFMSSLKPHEENA